MPNLFLVLCTVIRILVPEIGTAKLVSCENTTKLLDNTKSPGTATISNLDDAWAFCMA
jgi:hypothetical protein